MTGWLWGAIIPIVRVRMDHGYYAFILGVESAMLTVDAGLQVEGGFVMRGMDEMDILRRGGTGSRRI